VGRYRNLSSDERLVVIGVAYATWVKPDETIDVETDADELYAGQTTLWQPVLASSPSSPPPAPPSPVESPAEPEPVKEA
jgi:hypothetical protein